MKGLVWVWASATAAMFILFILFQFFSWGLGVIDVEIDNIRSEVQVDQSWANFYDTWVPKLRDFFGYMTAASFVSLIIYVIVNSARKEPEVLPV